MTLTVVPVYAGLLAILFVALSVRVIGARRTQRVAIGTGADPELERRVRVQANFAEYVPFALLLLVMAEWRGAPGILLHALGAALLLGRAAHAWGMSRTPEDFRFRTAGMATTFGVTAIAAVTLLVG